MNDEGDRTHLNALELRARHYRRSMRAAGVQRERTYWQVLVEQTAREIASELQFLGIQREPLTDASPDELLTLLNTD